ncbi:MAG: right-handed parallel beta-helix repeat-containing protein, partial [FCB group bacterium]|nr:right-handed parallel beta-helix repeat-containing protein [FCB group bacterium]
VISLNLESNLAPHLYALPSSLEFPLTTTGEISAKTFIIYNTGATDLIVSGWNMDNNAFYTSTDVGRVNSGDSVEVQIFFSPPSGAWHQGNFYIYSNDPDNLTQVVQLSGAGVLSGQPVIHVPITNFNLGDVILGETRTFAIQVFNTGNDTLTINGLSSTNEAFQVPATPLQIPANTSRAIDVTYIVNATGWFTAEIDINSNASNAPSLEATIQAYGYDAYFDPVLPTGEQYQIVATDITDATGYGLDEGDQIGVFDGLQCVGVGLYHGSDSLSISTWKALPDQGLPGYTDGNLIQFKYYLIDDDSNEHVFDIVPEFVAGDGAFGTGIFSLVNLEIIDRLTPFEPYAGPTFYVSADSGLDYINNGSFEQPFRTIQHSINVVENADTILVRPGTYVENINFNGKNIVLSSLYTTTVDTSFISQTIIDGNQSGSVVTIVNGEDPAAELIGFTIRNGSGTYMAIGYGGKKGGGIRIVGSSPTISNCYIIENHVTENNGNGGGIFCYNDSDPTISDCIISNNTAAEKGPGIQLNTDCDPVITNCLLNSNIGEYGGGVHALFNSNPIISNCTFTNNTAGSYGGAIAIRSGSHVYLKNSILWNNSANRGDEIGLYGEEGTATIEANYSDIAGGQGAISEEVGNGTIIWGTGNIDTDPSFVGYGTGNFNLLASSLCINAGDPTTFDEDGTRLDMGAYPYTNSYSGPDWYVSIEGNDHRGTGSVFNPFASIQAGINAATTPGDSVSVAPGTYVENINFRGRSIKVFGEQGAEQTIIDGDSSGSVVTFNSAESSNSQLAEFTIQNGLAEQGGGIYCHDASPKLVSLNISENSSSSDWGGGGVFLYGYANPFIDRCVINNNLGQGVFLWNSTVEMSGCQISNNSLSGIWYYGEQIGGASVLMNCTITDNGDNGINLGHLDQHPILTNSIIHGNNGQQLIIDENDNPIVTYCNIQDTTWSGIGNISIDPQFVNPIEGDYNLLETSGCINRGDPNSSYSDESEPNGDRINMGAYGNTSAAAIAVLTLAGPETVATEDSLYSVNITLPPDSQVVFSYSLIEGPDWVSFDESLAHISGIPDNAYVGHNELQLSVSDNYNRNDTLIYDVVVANSQPSITSAADTIGTEDQLYYYNIESTDEGIGATKYQALVLPIWLDLDSLSGELTGTPGDSAVGDTLVSIQFLDGNGGSDSQTFNLHIVNMNDAISIISIPDTMAIEDIEYVYEVQTLDDDLNDATRFNLNIAPYGMEIDSLTGRISWLPDNS